MSENKFKYAQAAYDAYSTFSEGVSLVSGSPLSTFADLPDNIKQAWATAAEAVLDAAAGENAIETGDGSCSKAA